MKIAGDGKFYRGNWFGPLGAWQVGDYVRIPAFPGNHWRDPRPEWIIRVRAVEDDGIAVGSPVVVDGEPVLLPSGEPLDPGVVVG